MLRHPAPRDGLTRRQALRTCAAALAGLALGEPLRAADARAADGSDLTPLQAELIQSLDALRGELVSVNQEIWTFAELGLEEHRSAARLAGVLKKAGFQVKE